MEAHILKLPPELLLRISNRLNTFELGQFRRTCTYVETSLFEPFAREFFTKRQFMVEDVSLQALVGIANHKNLSQYLTGKSPHIVMFEKTVAAIIFARRSGALHLAGGNISANAV
jgi:hypothetical protein